jgi:hypothetical protein
VGTTGWHKVFSLNIRSMIHDLAPLNGVREYEDGGHGFRNVIEVEVAVLPITSEVQAVPLILKAAPVVLIIDSLLVLAEIKLALEVIDADDGDKKEVEHHD